MTVEPDVDARVEQRQRTDVCNGSGKQNEKGKRNPEC
jgi:hypothetical protein